MIARQKVTKMWGQFAGARIIFTDNQSVKNPLAPQMPTWANSIWFYNTLVENKNGSIIHKHFVGVAVHISQHFAQPVNDLLPVCAARVYSFCLDHHRPYLILPRTRLSQSIIMRLSDDSTRFKTQDLRLYSLNSAKQHDSSWPAQSGSEASDRKDPEMLLASDQTSGPRPDKHLDDE